MSVNTTDDAMTKVRDIINRLYPDTPSRISAMAAAGDVLEGATSLVTYGTDYADTKERAADDLASLNGAIIAESVMGVSEVQIAVRSKLSRTTVRKVLGK